MGRKGDYDGRELDIDPEDTKPFLSAHAHDVHTGTSSSSISRSSSTPSLQFDIHPSTTGTTNPTLLSRSLSLLPRKPRLTLLLLTPLLLILFLTLLISALIPTSWLRLYRGSGIDNPIPPTNLDSGYASPRTLDIVIAIYNEPWEDVLAFVRDVKSLSHFRDLPEDQVKVWVYDKLENRDVALANTTTISVPSSSSSSSSSKNSTMLLTITPLPNIGREGHTYLTHILSQWSSLAKHTIFTQAHPHKPAHVLSKLTSSFHPTKTGFLGLAMSYVICPLSHCVDPWGWTDTFSHLPQIYASVYGTLVPAGQDVQLQYKGQFVVSGKRIRGVRKGVYEGWKGLLESEMEGWVHSDGRLDKVPGVRGWDGRGNPYLGHTLERGWGVLMQCGVRETGVWWKCRGEGVGGLGGVEDCGCLDEDEGVEAGGETGLEQEIQIIDTNPTDPFSDTEMEIENEIEIDIDE